MSERETALIEQVRAHYAAAATAVATAGEGTLTVLEDAGCCSPASCSGLDGEVEAGFGSQLYSSEEQGELPAQAVAASLGCGNPLMVAELVAG